MFPVMISLLSMHAQFSLFYCLKLVVRGNQYYNKDGILEDVAGPTLLVISCSFKDMETGESYSTSLTLSCGPLPT
ncbi:hypothetical protein Ddye_028800 [Dipteronia dyeriana]|uniref:Uncharacterized protein n=1 Tax=Dipteronia dyeriana TaxID=168575 RepID=A0AAD9WL59_9ROSI|nr:hypothetical protein Ddye_028800 [Dipteronia dyeriana]